MKTQPTTKTITLKGDPSGIYRTLRDVCLDAYTRTQADPIALYLNKDDEPLLVQAVFGDFPQHVPFPANTPLASIINPITGREMRLRRSAKRGTLRIGSPAVAVLDFSQMRAAQA